MDIDQLASGADRPYWEGLLRDELLLPQCANCRAWHWPAVFRCGDCGSWDIDWRSRKLEGTVFSWTRTWHGFGGLEGLELPFVSAVVSLDEVPDIRLMGVLENASRDPAIGDAVVGKIGRTGFAGSSVPAISWRNS